MNTDSIVWVRCAKCGRPINEHTSVTWTKEGDGLACPRPKLGRRAAAQTGHPMTTRPTTDGEWLANLARSQAEDISESGWWYVSFADPNRPTGTQFLGGLYIDGHSLPEALTRSHLLGLNPGGEAQFIEVPTEVLEDIPDTMRLRLLSREEVETA